MHNFRTEIPPEDRTHGPHQTFKRVAAPETRASSLLTRNVGLPISENKLWFAARKVQQHLRKVAIRPGEPRPSVRGGVVDVNRFVDETQTVRVLVI